MPAIDSTVVARYFNQGEQALSNEKDFLYDRISLSINSGTATYQLPDYCKSIAKVIWQGKYLEPLPQRNFREVFQSATQKGKPFWYIFNNVNLNNIQFFPNPSTTIAVVTDPWNLQGTNNYQNGVIVEFSRISDNLNFTVPPSLRRQLLKYWVARQVYSKEGPLQNLKLAQYYEKKWETKKQEFFDWLDEMYLKPRKFILAEIVSSNYFPAQPVLPIDKYGISVDEGQ